MPVWSKQIKPAPQPLGPLFEEAAAEGYAMVEWRSPTRNGTTVLETDLLGDPESRAEIRAQSEAHTIQLACHAPQGAPWNFGTLPFKIALAQFEESIRRAADINARIMTFHLGIANGPERRPALFQGARVVRDLLPYAEDRNITLSVENVFDEHSVATVEDCRQLFDAVDSPRLRFTLDTGHAHLCGCLYAMAKAFPDRLIFTHVHDNDSTGGGKGDKHRVPGRGTVNWKKLTAILTRIGYTGPINFELREEATLSELKKIWGRFSQPV